ncbi:hypothetical protein MMC13_007139 [Lambiella insularis]|nr:hypothetical protein [Lambiella insularis]
MPKQKQLLKLHKKRGKQTPTGPQTADEYLAGWDAPLAAVTLSNNVAVGVDLEEAGEKWRAGDPSKSSRFFTRAMETYEGGLNQFEGSFDLAYNKARLQYELSQQPRLLAELPISLIELLQLALESHRAALHLKQDDADTLFNTAQVLTSLGEITNESHSAMSDDKSDALERFQEALGLFQRCFAVQEDHLQEAQKLQHDIDMSISPPRIVGDQAQPAGLDSQSLDEEQWASVVEPVTPGTLLDTTIAQIELLTVVCNLKVTQDPTWLPWVEEYSSLLLKRAACYTAALSEGSDRVQEVSLSTANLTCACADAAFRTGHINLTTYLDELNMAFSKDVGLPDSAQALCDKADASLALTASIRVTINIASVSASDVSALNDVQWKQLTQALTDLTAATKVPNSHNLFKIHLRRGDCELMRYSLGKPPQSYKLAVQNADMLLKNAETYYRGAAKLAKIEMAGQDEAEALAKEAVASSLSGNEMKLLNLIKQSRIQVLTILEEMREENLIDIEDFVRLKH